MNRLCVSVVIPHYEDLENLQSCLLSLQQQTFPAEQFEIIVADNNSPIGREAVEEVVGKAAKLVSVLERGAGPARNGGVAASGGEILAFIDSDCRADPDWLAEGVAALRHFDFVGGRVDVSVSGERASATQSFERVFAFDFATYIKRKGFSGSGNLFVWRDVFDAVGGFGNGISEDVDWSHRASRLGFKLGYAAYAGVSHPARQNWRELRNKWERINRETYALYVRRRAGRWRWFCRTLLLPLSAIAHSPRVLSSDRLQSPRERLGALGILYLCRMWRFADAIKLTLTK